MESCRADTGGAIDDEEVVAGFAHGLPDCLQPAIFFDPEVFGGGHIGSLQSSTKGKLRSRRTVRVAHGSAGRAG